MKRYSLMSAAGTAKTVEQAVPLLRSAADGVVLGSFTALRRMGNAGVVDYASPTERLNVRGIPSPEPDEWRQTVSTVASEARRLDKQVWVSVAAFDPAEYALLACWALDAGADRVEANFSCPNMQEGGRFAPIISYRPHLIRQASLAMQAIGVPHGLVWAKLSPILDDALMAEVDEVLDGSPVIAGAVVMNTVPQCLVLSDQQPVITFGQGLAGMSGPAIKPIALGQVARHRSCLSKPVIAVGGISSGSDVRGFLSLGVVGVQVNSIVQSEGPSALDRLAVEAE